QVALFSRALPEPVCPSLGPPPECRLSRSISSLIAQAFRQMGDKAAVPVNGHSAVVGGRIHFRPIFLRLVLGHSDLGAPGKRNERLERGMPTLQLTDRYSQSLHRNSHVYGP